MTTLNPPTPAWDRSRGSDTLLDTRMPARLARKGYRATWPAGAEVDVVEGGLVPDALYDSGVRIVWDADTEQLFRFTKGEWRSVSGKTDVLLSRPVGGYVDGYGLGY